MGQRRRFLLPSGLVSSSVLLTLLIHLEPLATAGAQLAGSAVGWCALLAAMTLSSYCGMFQLQQCHLQGSPDMWHLSSPTTACAHVSVLGLTVITMLLPALHVEETISENSVEAPVEEAVNCEIMQALLTMAAVIMAGVGCQQLFTALSTERLQSAYNAVSTSDSELNMPELQFSTVECRTTSQPTEQSHTVVVSDGAAPGDRARIKKKKGNRPASQTKSDDIFPSADRAVPLTAILVESAEDAVTAPPELEAWKEAYAIDSKIPPGMKRHCKQHGIDKTAAVKMLKHADIDLDDTWHGPKEDSSYQFFKERCVLLFQRVLHRWQADMEALEDGVLASGSLLDSAEVLNVAHDFIEKKTLLEFWLDAPDIHKLLKKFLPYDKDQKYKIVKIEHWEALMVSQLESQGAEQFAIWLSRFEDVFLKSAHVSARRV